MILFHILWTLMCVVFWAVVVAGVIVWALIVTKKGWWF